MRKTSREAGGNPQWGDLGAQVPQKHQSMGLPATKLQPVAIVALTVPLNYNDVHV